MFSALSQDGPGSRSYIDSMKRLESNSTGAGSPARTAEIELPLTADQKTLFHELHAKVVQFAKDSVEVMKALHIIREQKLYRDQYKTWEHYCDSVHHVSRQYGNRLASAGRTLKEMETEVVTGLPLPENEPQLTELGKIDDLQQRMAIYQEAYEKAKQDCKILSAQRIMNIRLKRLGHNGHSPAPRTKNPTSSRLSEVLAIIPRLEEAVDGNAAAMQIMCELKDILKAA